MSFDKEFGKYVCDGDSIDCHVDGGFHCYARLHYDEDTRAPADHPQVQAWERDEWHYFAVAVTVWKHGVKLTGDYDHALWGIEGNCPGDDNSYFRAVANDLLPDALASAQDKIRELCAS